ncbi:hypothetical protein N2605_04395 [Bradyrhizobium yuanmingense]|uniref:hypothetical protein n=1 Tax=Bradyrhizobium TaxID=374 RepID=UPI001CD71B29|nr:MULTISPECIES: hypothetical protein [unclassified Bradyrhizobium]MCA1384412.1 hypothetical protein [Bradyrhizobium sp. BRP05]MCA1421141.1 hypothetical protein [Bradyrhizobium sp. BRP23]MCA1436755.1 hypothetical protein [Bradyrhizobium sp. BRP20]MCA1512399.1 hypothetical protein [Bradyrhizobium sp. NBAIM01]UWU85709.1 hypothetical protein N2605_04395 [Bradyrhizobium sp. CB1024]
MKMWINYRTLFLTAVVAATLPSSISPAQPKDDTLAAPKQTGTAAPGDARPNINTNTNPFKHRYWRHRGGKHPHFGSRRVRS